MIEEIKRIAFELGFDQVGVTSYKGLEAGERAVADWVAEGRHGSMKYMAEFSSRKKRFDQEMPDAKSVIVLGVNYYTSRESSAMSLESNSQHGSRLLGRVARYAWGKDYHAVIAERHQQLIEKIQALAGVKFKAKSCVDTQPVPERFAAVQAGLGFIGKHTGLLSKQFGPWLFLSEIVTNLSLPEDLPAKGDCGTCVDCQTVCPTGALDQDYKIDARLCIAYWTIEHKGVIPRNLRPKIKDWIFGCDECFAVCPFTSKSKESRWPELGPDSGTGPFLSFEELFDLSSNARYEKQFQGTALLRAGRNQMLRNACIVLGNSGKPEALPYIRRAFGDTSALVRLHAAWALGQLRTAEAKTELEARALTEKDPEVLEEIRFALS